jgi:Protein of unknown function (DUF3892)
MPDKLEITCITKSDRMNPHERITHVGGSNVNGTPWRLTQQDAIQGIDAQKWQFYVRKGGLPVDVIVETSRYGHRYLKTRPDGEQPNNLLSLAECR